MPQVHFNHLAIVVAAVGTFLLGAVWYSPPLFAKAWMRANGYSPETVQEMQKGAGRAYAVSFACYLAMAAGFAVLVFYMNLRRPDQGAQLGLLVWGGFLAPLGLGALMFSNRRLAAWAIDAAYQLLYCLWMGILLTLWR